MEAIKLDNLTKYYGEHRGIDGVNLTVNSGEFFGFIGPNGAGKSTTIRTILGLLSPTKGSAKILGLDIATQKTEILSKIGYLPSEAVFYPNMKVKDVIKLSANLRKVDCQTESLNLSKRIQLDTEKKINELSFGNRKKVGIVCALQHMPELIILDEPTSGLDPLMQKEFFEILRERNKQGATIFLSGHVLSEIQNNCDRAAIIKGGKIIACGDMSTLSSANFKRVKVIGKIDISGLDNIKNIVTENDTTSFLYSGNVNLLIKTLSNNEITDFTVTEPSLDEIFLHYYEDGGQAQ